MTVGVLASKAKPQQTSAGSMMSIWTLGNLQGSQATLFLFGDAHSTCYTQTEGSLLAILDGKVPPSTMRFGNTAKVLAECKLKHYRISECPSNLTQLRLRWAS